MNKIIGFTGHNNRRILFKGNTCTFLNFLKFKFNLQNVFLDWCAFFFASTNSMSSTLNLVCGSSFLSKAAEMLKKINYIFVNKMLDLECSNPEVYCAMSLTLSLEYLFIQLCLHNREYMKEVWVFWNLLCIFLVSTILWIFDMFDSLHNALQYIQGSVGKICF